MSFTYQRRIYLADTDAAKVIYFAQLLAICHEAYEEFFSKAGIDFAELVDNDYLAIPIVHAAINFHQPIFCGDLLQIQLKVTEVTDNSFQIVYQVYKSAAKVATAVTKHLGINPLTRQRTQLTPKIVEYLYSQTK